jgi:hypothetical protein
MIEYERKSTMSTSVNLPVSEQLYTVIMHHTQVVDYGYSVEDLASGRAIPLSGARIDIAFEGRIEGPNLNGTVAGVDFGVVRADGRFQLNIQATITTDDGERIALHADGIFRPGDGAVRENVTLTTASPKYAWVNQLQIWATGSADMGKREVRLQGYVA